MSPRATGWLRFALLYVSLALVLGGVVLFVGFATHVYHYDFQEARATPPNDCCVVQYDQLTPPQRAMVDRAIAGTQYQFAFDSPNPIPQEIVEKDGTYYVFSYYTTFDWFDYHTSGPALVSLSGAAIGLLTIRWEHRSSPFA